MRRLLLCFAFYAALTAEAFGQSSASAPLQLETDIGLPNTTGRIDHLSIDLDRMRLFVAELGNHTVDVVDLRERKVIHRIAGLDKPQGIVYVPKLDLLVVALGGDGTVRVFEGSDYAPRGVVDLGDDADNVRLDPQTENIVVGHGSGGLAVINPAVPEQLFDVALPGHPEGFQLLDGRAYVNVPDAHEVDVVNLATGELTKWTVEHLTSNYPMAVDGAGHVAAIFRGQNRLVLFDASSGSQVSMIDICGDADDVFFDSKRQRFMVSCGAGAVDVIGFDSTALHPLARFPTSLGARTSLYVPELDRLFVAARAPLFGSKASIKILRPAP